MLLCIFYRCNNGFTIYMRVMHTHMNKYELCCIICYFHYHRLIHHKINLEPKNFWQFWFFLSSYDVHSTFFQCLVEIKHQLNEQLRCLDQRFEAHYCMVWELQDFYQRRAEVELEYARNLDKLVKQIMMRHRAEKQRLVYVSIG